MLDLGVAGELGSAMSEEPLLARVLFHQTHLLAASAGHLEVAERRIVDGKDRASGPVLGRHVRERGAVRHGEAGKPRSEELHELADHAVRSKPFVQP